MNGWGEFFWASVIFLISHSLPVRPAVKSRIVRSVGRNVFLIGYSAISLGVLGWLILAAGRAPYVSLWPMSQSLVWSANAMMLLALLFAICGTGIANPFSLGGVSGKTYTPDAQGFVAVTRHPLLWALALWAGAHTLVNGDLAHVLLFGAMGAFSLFGIGLMERRARQRFGPSWKVQTAGTSVLPFMALLRGPRRWSNLLQWRALLVLPLWWLIVHIHHLVLGVSPLPVL